MNKTSIKRPGAGRTVGSTSFIMLPISALCGKFADMNTPVKVSRLWAESMGLHGTAPQAIVKNELSMPKTVDPIPFSVTNFDNDETPATLAQPSPSEEVHSDSVVA